MGDIEQYNAFEAQMLEVEASANFIPDVSTTEGYEKSKRIGLDGRKVYNAIDKVRSELGSDARKMVENINKEGKKHLSRIDAAINPHIEARKSYDAEIKRIELEKIQAVTDRINLFCVPFEAYSMTSDQIGGVIEIFQEDKMEGFGNRLIEAGSARDKAIADLVNLKASKILHEEENRRIAEQKIQNDIQAEENRKAQEIIAAANKAESERLEKEREEIESIKSEEQVDAFMPNLIDPQELAHENNNEYQEFMNSMIMKANECPFSNTTEKAIAIDFIGEINGIVAKYKNRVK